ncbi:unnamed protein product [Mucor hiemalis]
MHQVVIRAKREIRVYCYVSRVGHRAKEASDAESFRSVFSFLVVGNLATFYLLLWLNEHIYAIIELEHIYLPMTLSVVPLFRTQITQLVQIIKYFDIVLEREKHGYSINHPQQQAISCIRL